MLGTDLVEPFLKANFFTWVMYHFVMFMFCLDKTEQSSTQGKHAGETLRKQWFKRS